MPKSKLTLIVDGNCLLMSRLAVLSNKYVDDYDLNQESKLMLIKSILKRRYSHGKKGRYCFQGYPLPHYPTG